MSDKKIYKPMRTYATSHEMAKKLADLRNISLVEAVDLALKETLARTQIRDRYNTQYLGVEMTEEEYKTICAAEDAELRQLELSHR